MNPNLPPPPNPLPLNNQAALQTANTSSTAITDPNNPLGSTLAPALGKIQDIGQNNLATGAAANAAVNSAQLQVAAAKAAADAKNDPSKYTKVQTQDGGFKFYGPDGQEVSAADYAKVNQVPVDKVLADSQNPIDQAFQQDYQQLQQYFSDKLNSSQNESAAANAKATEAAVKKNYGIDLSKLNHADVVKQFMQAYPTVFGLHTTGVQGTNALLPPPTVKDTTSDSSL